MNTHEFTLILDHAPSGEEMDVPGEPMRAPGCWRRGNAARVVFLPDHLEEAVCG